MFVNKDKEINSIRSFESQKHEFSAITEQNTQESLSSSRYSRAGERRLKAETRVLPASAQRFLGVKPENKELVEILEKYPFDPIYSAVRANDKKAVEIMARNNMKFDELNNPYHRLSILLTRAPKR